MPFDGSGNYVPAAAPNFPALGGAVISSIYYNATINDIVAALNNCVTRDGQGKPSAAISWNGQNLSGINNLTTTNLTVTNAPTFAGLTANAVINANAGIIASSATFDSITANFSAQSAGQVGYHMYNTGAVCEWLMRQPAHATGDYFAISSVVAGAISDRFTIDPNGNATLLTGQFIINTNHKGSYFTDVSGTHPYFICQNDNNFVFYGTDATGASRGIWSVFMRNSTSVMAFTLTPTCPTAPLNDNSISVATTQFVQTAKAPVLQSVTSAATVTPAFANDMVIISAQATGLTLANPTGAFPDGWGVVIRINDNGTAQTIAFGTAYRAIGTALPTTTVIGKTLYIGMVLNSAAGKWDVITVVQG